MEYQKITNLLNTTSDNIPRFITKKRTEVHDQPGSAGNRYSQVSNRRPRCPPALQEILIPYLQFIRFSKMFHPGYL